MEKPTQVLAMTSLAFSGGRFNNRDIARAWNASNDSFSNENKRPFTDEQRQLSSTLTLFVRLDDTELDAGSAASVAGDKVLRIQTLANTVDRKVDTPSLTATKGNVSREST